MQDSMGTATNKPTTKEEQIEVPVSPIYGIYGQQLKSIGEQINETDARITAKEAELAKMREDTQKAKAEGRSVFDAFVQKQKPVYDKKKEKDLRWKSTIQALGDMLGAVSSGYFAYRKGGQGETPMATSNAFEEVNKISEMQEKYIRERKAWDELDLKWKQAKVNNDIEAQETLLSREEAVLAEYKKRRQELEEAGITVEGEIAKTLIEQIKADEKRARNMEDKMFFELWRHENDLSSSGKEPLAEKNAKEKAKKDAEDEILAHYGMFHGFGMKKEDWYREGVRIGERDASKTLNDLTPTERKAYLNKAHNDPFVLAYEYLLEEGGMLPTDAEQLVKSLMGKLTSKELSDEIRNFENVDYLSFVDFLQSLLEEKNN